LRYNRQTRSDPKRLRIQASGDTGYIFKHAISQDVAYDSLFISSGVSSFSTVVPIPAEVFPARGLSKEKGLDVVAGG
jgi:hypothetical protein